MIIDVQAHSFDRPRQRTVPSSYRLCTLDGEVETRTFDRLTLVVAIKSSCDGCRDFVRSTLSELQGVTVVVISAAGDVVDEWRDVSQTVFVAPELWDALDIRSAPFYVLVQPAGPNVVREGFVLGPAQVAQEIAPFLDH